jgi:hypothetical protein
VLSSGMPPEDAMAYFLPDMDPVDRLAVMRRWLPSANLQHAIRALQGKSWTEMDLQERIKISIDKHYTEVAYFLYTHNYASLTGADKTKADTCRQVLEAKLAGMAGKTDALSSFWNDLVSGKVKLNGPAMASLPA